MKLRVISRASCHKPSNMQSRASCAKRSRCHLHISNEFMASAGSDYAAHVELTTNFSSPQPPRTSKNSLSWHQTITLQEKPCESGTQTNSPANQHTQIFEFFNRIGQKLPIGKFDCAAWRHSRAAIRAYCRFHEIVHVVLPIIFSRGETYATYEWVYVADLT